MQALSTALRDREIALELFEPKHVEGLRAACAMDSDIWEIYPLCMAGEHFDQSLKILENLSGWIRYAITIDGNVAGMTSYIPTKSEGSSIEIGGTYITPNLRGSTANTRIKRLLIDHAFQCDYDEIQFRVDTRNKRSMRAVEKLGARLVSIDKKNMTTWTGFVRDTAVFSLFRE